MKIYFAVAGAGGHDLAKFCLKRNTLYSYFYDKKTIQELKKNYEDILSGRRKRKR